MPTAIRMPRLGMTMREGTVVAWPVPLGERVEKGQTVLVIESEKTEAEIEATASGFLRHVYVPAGETVPCGSLLAVLTETPEEPFDPEAFAAREGALPESAAPAPARPARSPERVAPRAGPRPAAPAARALARKLGIDVGEVPGTGPGGRVTRQDVESFAAAGERRVRVAEDVALEVLREGEGEAVLLLPGFGTDVSSLALQARALAGHFGVIAVNPRGVGLSDAPQRAAYGIAEAAADAAALLEAPAHLVGASLGAAVALELALAHPDRVRSLVLLTPFLTARPRLRAVLGAWSRVARETSAETLARMLLPWLFSERVLADAASFERTARGLAATLARVPAPTLERTAAGIEAWSGSREGALAAIDVPTSVLVAGGDLLVPDGASVGAAIPRARTVVVPEAGHALASEAPEQVNAAILDHLHIRATAG